MKLIDKIVGVIYNDPEPLIFTHIVLNKKDLKNIVKKHYLLYDKNKNRRNNFYLFGIKIIRSKDVKIGDFLLIEDFKKNE